MYIYLNFKSKILKELIQSLDLYGVVTKVLVRYMFSTGSNCITLILHPNIA